MEFGSFIIGYVTIGSVALYLQFRSNVTAMDKLSDEHQQHTADLRHINEKLHEMLALLHREAKS